jgi:hypothetical protein
VVPHPLDLALPAGGVHTWHKGQTQVRSDELANNALKLTSAASFARTALAA